MDAHFYQNSIISAILAASIGTCFFIAYFIFEFNIIHGKDRFYNSINKKYFNINNNVISLYRKGLISKIYSCIFMGLELLFTVLTTIILSFFKINLFQDILMPNLSFILYVFVYLYGVLMFLSMFMVSLISNAQQKKINSKIKIKELIEANFFIKNDNDLHIQIRTKDNIKNIHIYAYMQNTIIKLSYKYKIDIDYYYYLIWKIGHLAKKISKKNKNPWVFIINKKKIITLKESQIIDYLVLYIRSNINIEDLKNIFKI